MADWKNSVNLPRTDFPMKANLQVAEPAAIARQAFEHAAALAAAVPLWGLRCPRGLGRLDGTVGFLAALDAEA